MNAVVVGLAMAVVCGLLAYVLAWQARSHDMPLVDMRMGSGGLIIPVLTVAAAVGVIIAAWGAVSLMLS